MLKKCIAGATLLMISGFFVGRHTAPEKLVTVEKEVIERVITRPDGTVEKERITKDKKETEIKPDNKEKKSQYKVSALVGLDFKEKKEVYGIDIQKRMLGNISAGIWGTTAGQIGVSIGYEF